MMDVWVALLAGAVPGALVFALSRIFGGSRRDRDEHDQSVAAQWRDWSQEQGRRIDDLEKAVEELKASLLEERESNRLLTLRNERQSSLLTSLIRWAILLRDEVVRLGGQVPPAPVEVEAALTNLDA